VDSAVMLLADEAGSKKSSASAKDVLHKVQSQLESLQKKISNVNTGIQKYV